jgi:hemoglobin
MKPTPYETLGGEAPLRALVHRFYELMDTLPEAQGIRKLHLKNLARSEEKLFMFLSGWMDGPPLYVQKYGDPQMRARHLPFPIGDAERDQWLLCMRRAMAECVADETLRKFLDEKLTGLADFLRNK